MFAEPGSLPGGTVAAWVLSWLWIPTLGIVPFLFVLFPDGQLRSGPSRLIAGLTAAAVVLTLVGRAFAPGPMENAAGVPNPYGTTVASRALEVAEASGNALLAVTMIASVIVVIARFRRAGGVEQRQIKWLAFAGVLMVVAFSAADALESRGLKALADNVSGTSLLAIPLAMAVAVLRYHLYDIDIVLNKSVVFGGLALFITAVYLVVVAGVGAAVGRGAGSNLALAVVATALVGVAFQPLRARLERIARRFVFGPPTSAERQAGVAINCLGAFRLFRDGTVVPVSAWQSKRARTLLKILIARRGRATTRDYLMDTLWPDESPELVSRRLSVALTTIRAVLDPDKQHPADRFVIGDNDAVRLDLTNVPIDVEQFLATAADGLAAYTHDGDGDATAILATAASSYRGDFLEEDPYEDWAAPLRDEARATYVAVVRALAEAATRAGDVDEAVRNHMRVLEKDPWDENAHLALVEILERAGRHGEAHRSYAVYTSRMEELRVPVAPFPSPNPA